MRLTSIDVLLHFLPLDGAIGFIHVANASALHLVEIGSVDAGHGDGRCGVQRADDEQIFLLVVANQTGHRAVVGRSREAVRIANALLVRRGMFDELPSAVGQRMWHASL